MVSWPESIENDEFERVSFFGKIEKSYKSKKRCDGLLCMGGGPPTFPCMGVRLGSKKLSLADPPSMGGGGLPQGSAGGRRSQLELMLPPHFRKIKRVALRTRAFPRLFRLALLWLFGPGEGGHSPL